MVGGISFDPNDLDRFLLSLHEKYPNAVIVTGEAQGSEKHAAESARLLGFTVETVPEPDANMYGDGTPRVHVERILNLPRVDVIVTMGSPGGRRAKAALEIWKRCDNFNNGVAKIANVPMPSARKFHSIAALEKKKPTTRRATKTKGRA
jgi:hypothetical protein